MIDKEEESYPTTSFIADLGGTVGLIFGLNLMLVIQLSNDFVSVIISGIKGNLSQRVRRKNSRNFYRRTSFNVHTIERLL